MKDTPNVAIRFLDLRKIVKSNLLRRITYKITLKIAIMGTVNLSTVRLNQADLDNFRKRLIDSFSLIKMKLLVGISHEIVLYVTVYLCYHICFNPEK